MKKKTNLYPNTETEFSQNSYCPEQFLLHQHSLAADPVDSQE